MAEEKNRNTNSRGSKPYSIDEEPEPEWVVTNYYTGDKYGFIPGKDGSNKGGTYVNLDKEPQ